MSRFVILSALLAMSTSSAAFAAQEGFHTSCQPAETSDMARSVRTKIYNQLKTDKLNKQITVTAKVRILNKRPAPVALDNLTSGFAITLDPATLEHSVTGNASGHSCTADAQLDISIKVTRKDGTVLNTSSSTNIEIPGNYATKARVLIP